MHLLTWAKLVHIVAADVR